MCEIITVIITVLSLVIALIGAIGFVYVIYKGEKT